MNPYKQAFKIIKEIIREEHPDHFVGRGSHDIAGNKINCHMPSTNYPAEVNWETKSWCEYITVDKIQEALEKADIPINIEFQNSYAVTLEQSNLEA